MRSLTFLMLVVRGGDCYMTSLHGRQYTSISVNMLEYIYQYGSVKVANHIN